MTRGTLLIVMATLAAIGIAWMWVRRSGSEAARVRGTPGETAAPIAQPTGLGAAERPQFEVRVLDPDGNPLPGARVQLSLDTGRPPWTPNFETVGDEFETDALGVATLPRFADTSVAISVLVPGYARTDRDLGRLQGERPRLEVHLPAGEAALRFVDRSGTPLSLEVGLERRRAQIDTPWRRLARSWSRSDEQETDATGRVTFRGLEDGEYHPRLRDSSYAVVAGPATIRPGGAESTWTVVARDDEMPPPRSTILLRDAATDAPIHDASVVVVETDEMCLDSLDGEAAFHAPRIPPGPYDLAVFVRGYLPARVSRLPLNATDAPVTVRVTLDRGVTVEGTVHDEGGRPVPGVQVGVTGEEGASATTDDAGAFTLSGLAAGSRNLVVTSPHLARTVEKVARLDRGPAVHVDLVVEMAGGLTVQTAGDPQGHTVQLELRDSGGATVGRVSVEWFLSPGGRPRGIVEFHTFESLPPGDYRLLVTWNGEAAPPIPVVVRLGETTRVTISPP